MSSELISRLDDWARQRQIWPKEFRCNHYEKCKESLGGALTLAEGGTCSMSYVGKDYGQPVGGKPFNLVFVGIDQGWKGGGEDFAKGQRGCEIAFYDGANEFNLHYLEVIRTAAALLGQVGQYCLNHCFEQKRCDGDKRDSERCVLRSFAQGNLAKCAPESDVMRSQTTNLMRTKCGEHLVSELSILKPHVLVFHAADARWCFPPAAERDKWRLSCDEEAPKYLGKPVLHFLKAEDFECHLLFLNHPSSERYLRRQLPKQWSVVKPIAELLRSRGAIPQ